MRLGISVIDLDHRQLVTLFSLLDDALPLMPSQMVDMLVESLRRETREHFQREEALLVTHKPPGLEDHLRDHALFLALLGDLEQAVADKHLEAAQRVVAECRQFFKGRLLPADTALVEFVSATAGSAGRTP